MSRVLEYRSEYLWFLAYLLLISLASAKIASMPIHSYDPYFYSYLASGTDLKTFQKIPELPIEWRLMPDQAIIRSRGFFTVKPLFVGMIRAAARMGVGVLQAPFVISMLAYFCLGLVLWLWLGDLSVPCGWRVVAACLVLFSSVATDTARQGTPDMLCTVLIVAGAWLLLTKQNLKHVGILLLLFSIPGRTDSIVFGGLLLVLAAWRRLISLSTLAWSSAAFVLTEALVARRGYSYHEFVSATLRSSYRYGLLHNFARTELAIYMPFIFLGVLAIKAKIQDDLVYCCFASWVIRYLLLPHLEIRYLLPQAMVLGVAASAMGLSSKSSAFRFSEPREMDEPVKIAVAS